MSLPTVSGFSKVSRILLFGIAPFMILLLAGVWAVKTGKNIEFRELASSLLSFFLVVLMGGALVGFILGIIGRVRRDDAPMLGLVCAILHGTLVVATSVSIFLFMKKGVDAKALAYGSPTAPGMGVTLTGDSPQYQLYLSAPWQEVPVPRGSNKQATRGEGVLLSVSATPARLDVSQFVTKSLESFRKENPDSQLLGSQTVVIDSREWLRIELTKKDQGISQIFVIYLYGGREGTYQILCLMPANLRNTAVPALAKDLSGFRFPKNVGVGEQSELISQAEKFLRERKQDEAWQLVHSAPSSESEGLVVWLLENQAALDSRFWFEIPRRLAISDTRAAIWHWLRARIHAEYERRRCLAEDTAGIVDRLEQEICPTLPDIAKNNRITTQDVARLVLVSGVLDRSPANLPAWLINGSPTLMAARQKKLANGEVFDAAEWFVPEERWMDIRDQILVEYRQKYTR
jgi:hypothetical protein